MFFTSKSALQHYAEYTQWLWPRLIKHVSSVTGRCSSEGLAGKLVQVSLHVHSRTFILCTAKQALDLAILNHLSAEDEIEDIMIRYGSLGNVSDYRLDDWGSMLVKGGYFSLWHHAQTGPRASPLPFPVDTIGSFPGHKSERREVLLSTYKAKTPCNFISVPPCIFLACCSLVFPAIEEKPRKVCLVADVLFLVFSRCAYK